MKKGFTLIELLAVIVVLAIIALIAVPVVLNIINEAKESSLLRSAEFYLNAVDYTIANAFLYHGGLSSGTYPITGDGNICKKTLPCDDANTLKVEVNGDKPTGGYITIDSGIISDVSLTLNDRTIVKNNKGELIYKIEYSQVLLIDYIKNLYNETTTTTLNGIEYSLDETNSLMNDRLGSSSVAKLAGNIRYYGASPNNYIDIGDRDSEGNIIFWRIIGLFKDVEVTDESGNVTKTEDLVKIIRADKLTAGSVDAFSWDYNLHHSWTEASIPLLLNNEENGYYASGTIAYYYDNEGDLIPVTLDFTRTGLSNIARSKVEKVKWQAGSVSDNGGYVNELYLQEKSGANWLGKIALMNLSDYGYSVNLKTCNIFIDFTFVKTCRDVDNWLINPNEYSWFLNNRVESPFVLVLSENGLSSSYPGNQEDVHPVMYLKSNVNVVDEKETATGLKYLVVE